MRKWNDGFKELSHCVLDRELNVNALLASNFQGTGVEDQAVSHTFKKRAGTR